GESGVRIHFRLSHRGTRAWLRSAHLCDSRRYGSIGGAECVVDPPALCAVDPGVDAASDSNAQACLHAHPVLAPGIGPATSVRLRSAARDAVVARADRGDGTGGAASASKSA